VNYNNYDVITLAVSCVFYCAIGTLRIFGETEHDQHIVVACRSSRIICYIAVFEVVSRES